MYINDLEHKLDHSGLGFYTHSDRVGGSSLGKNLIDWIFNEVGVESCSRYLEIGTFNGLVLSLLAEKYSEKEFHAIDPFIGGENAAPGYMEFVYANNKSFKNVYIYVYRSDYMLPQLIARGEKFDLIFIDGDHSYESTLSDLQFCSKLINPGGKVFVHDIGLSGVIKGTDEFACLTGIEKQTTKESVFLFQF